MKCIRRDSTIDNEETKDEERGLKVIALSYSVLKELEEVFSGCLADHLDAIVQGIRCSMIENKHKVLTLTETGNFIVWLRKKYQQAFFRRRYVELLLPVAIESLKIQAKDYEKLKLGQTEAEGEVDPWVAKLKAGSERVEKKGRQILEIRAKMRAKQREKKREQQGEEKHDQNV